MECLADEGHPTGGEIDDGGDGQCATQHGGGRERGRCPGRADRDHGQQDAVRQGERREMTGVVPRWSRNDEVTGRQHDHLGREHAENHPQERPPSNQIGHGGEIADPRPQRRREGRAAGVGDLDGVGEGATALTPAEVRVDEALLDGGHLSVGDGRECLHEGLAVRAFDVHDDWVVRGGTSVPRFYPCLMGKNTAKARPTEAEGGGRSGQFLLIGGAAAIVVIVAVVVAALTGGGGSVTQGDVEQFRPVGVAGQPLVAFGGETSTDPAIGTIAPVIDGQSFTGAPLSIKPGKPTLVVFLAHWCPACQAEVPKLVEWAESLGVPFGLEVFGVATGTSADSPNYPPSVWLAREDFPFPVIADDEAFTARDAFGINGYPGIVMLGPDGAVQWRLQGGPGEGVLETLVAESMAAFES